MDTELHIAKEKAIAYQATKEDILPLEQNDSNTEDSWLDIIDQRITEAMEQGDFDNLLGQGKPLDFSQDLLAPDEKYLAYKLLKNNDLIPAWIGERGDIQAKIEKWRTALSTKFEQSQHEWKTTNLVDIQMKIQKEWTNYLIQQQLKLQELNKEITALNLQQPIASLEIFHLRVDEEFEKLGIRNLLDQPNNHTS